MDYDKTNVPSTYDAGRDTSQVEKLAFLSEFASKTGTGSVTKIIDLGCGTGRYTEVLSEVFDADVLGVEPSEKMRAQAQAKSTSSRLSFNEGAGGRIPAGDASTDLIFMSMVVHHLPDVGATARECARVLKPGGYVCIWNTVADEAGTYPYLSVFPSIQGIIESKLTARSDLDHHFASVGLDLFDRDIVTHVVAQDWQRLADKMSLRADSFVAQLPDDEYETGLRALYDLAANAESTPRALHVDRIIYRRR